MNETPQQYTQRILSYIEGKEPIAVQAATAKRLSQLIEGVYRPELRRRPAPDKWSVSEIIAHLADGEIVGGFRIRFILGSPGSPVVAYDQDKWVTSGHYDKRDPQKSVELFHVLREANLAVLESLEPDASTPSAAAPPKSQSDGQLCLHWSQMQGKHVRACAPFDAPKRARNKVVPG